MEKKEQRRMRFTDVELSMLKNTFAENEALLMAMRKVFLQFPLTKQDKEHLSIFKDKTELMKLMEKTFNPTLDPGAPFHQLIDLWMSVDVKDKDVDSLMPVFKSRQMLINLMEQQLYSLKKTAEGKKTRERIKLDKLVTLEGNTSEQFYVCVMARNSLIAHVETQLSQMEILSGMKEETVEQTKDRLMKNSNK